MWHVTHIRLARPISTFPSPSELSSSLSQKLNHTINFITLIYPLYLWQGKKPKYFWVKKRRIYPSRAFWRRKMQGKGEPASSQLGVARGRRVVAAMAAAPVAAPKAAR
ncbi:Uncharacterized protein TCM_024279 [Theobroma cacao]|uniref:Uncharacterized protein n=1 Tax=Theobroma cacao TaxID=3641 RepID=A0A061EV44_THECC|nr:Uncharacterized protein TCM_024279 [Theobroma cacao]